MEIRVVSNILKANDAIAQENRSLFKEKGVFVVNVMGSPGAGKTSLLLKTIEGLGNGLRIGVIEGDIATTYDAELIQQTGVPVVQINTDGACHLDANMVKGALSHFDLSKIDLLFIENVGNLVCPASFKLGEAAKVTVLSVPEGDDKPKKYPAMFGIADCVILNKIDTLSAFDFDVVSLRKDILSIKDGMEIFEISCKSGEGFSSWINWLKSNFMNTPSPIHLDYKLKPVLAVGAELKNTFCLTRGNTAFLSQPIGDLKNLETLKLFEQKIKQYKKLLKIEPEIVSCDLHPDYLSTKFAKDYCSLLPALCHLLPVQHHHAHIASCMADNGIKEKVIGVAADGMGFGEDGKIWGFEFLIADFYGFKRCAHLKYIPMPGGDRATQEPWRMAVSYLYSAYQDNLPDKFTKRWGQERVSFIARMIERSVNSPLTSSAGRLFDAVSSLIRIRDVVEHEAQAAIELEKIADKSEQGMYNFEIFEDGEVFIIDPTKTVLEIVEDINRGTATSIISAKFHNTFLNFILKTSKLIREILGINKVALSGGVFQNRYLLGKIKPKLEEEGFAPLLHCRVPTNDGGVSLGQAVIASKRAKEMGS